MLSFAADYYIFVAYEFLLSLHATNILLLLYLNLLLFFQLKYASCETLSSYILDLSCSFELLKSLQIYYCKLHNVSCIFCKI